VNKVMIIGRLGKDPETRYTANGKPVTNFSVATSERWTKDGEKQERTEWHNVVAFDKLAEIISRVRAKGSQIFIEGKIQTRKWQDKEGKDRYSTEIVANQMEMLGGKSAAEKSAQPSESAPVDEFPDDSSIPF
jgi:single-strand DNA-binding protein